MEKNPCLCPSECRIHILIGFDWLIQNYNYSCMHFSLSKRGMNTKHSGTTLTIDPWPSENRFGVIHKPRGQSGLEGGKPSDIS